MIKLRKLKRGSFLSNFFLLFSGNIVAQIIPLLFAPIIARLFTPADFALQGDFISLVSIIAIIGAGRYELAFILPEKEKKANTLLYIAIRIAFIITLLSLLLIFFSSQIGRLYKSDAFGEYMPFIAIGVLLMVSYSIFSQWHTRFKTFKPISISKVIQSFGLSLVTILFGYLHFGAKGLIFGWIIGISLGAIMLLPGTIKKSALKLVERKDVAPTMKEYRDFPLVNSLHAFTDLFFTQFLLFTIITREFGLICLGLFFMMNKYMRAPIRLIGSSIGQVFYKEANDKYLHNESVTRVAYNTLKISLIFGVPALLLISFFGKSIFSWYLGKQWYMSGVYAQIMATPMFLNLLSSPISSIPLIYNKQKTAYLISLSAYILSISGIYYGVFQHWHFVNTLKVFSLIMSVYYLALIIWYFSLSKKSE